MGKLTFQANLGGSVNLIGPNTANTLNLTLPSAAGTNGQPLVTDGSGNLSFGTLSPAGGGTGITSLGTGVATALGTNVGTAGAFVVNGGALGTPSSGTATNLTGLPLSTGVTGTLSTTNGGTGLTSFTANGVVYASSTSALATGSALTFDGSALGVSSASNNQLSLNAVSSVTGTRITFSRNGTATTYFGDAFSITGANLDATALITAGTNPLIFGVGTEGMRLTSTGLGIGTSSPSQKLTVAGNILSLSSSGTDSFINVATNGVQNTYLGFNNSGSTNTNGVLNNYSYVGNGNAYGLQLLANGGVAATLNTSGNLGLGVTPSAWLSAQPSIQLKSGSYFATSGQYAFFTANTYLNGSGVETYIANGAATKYTHAVGQHQWHTAPSGTAGNAITFTQAATLDASGNFLVGTTSTGPVNANAITIEPSNSRIRVAHSSTANATPYIQFDYNGGNIGSITQLTTTTVAYNVSSDQRLKQNIVDAPEGNVDAIKVRSFDWVADGSHQTYGMVAQELLDVAPYAVSVPANPEEMMGVDYSKLVPMLVKEIQSLRKRLAAAGIA